MANMFNLTEAQLETVKYAAGHFVGTVESIFEKANPSNPVVSQREREEQFWLFLQWLIMHEAPK